VRLTQLAIMAAVAVGVAIAYDQYKARRA